MLKQFNNLKFSKESKLVIVETRTLKNNDQMMGYHKRATILYLRTHNRNTDFLSLM